MEAREPLARVRTRDGGRFLVKAAWVARLFDDGRLLPPSRAAGRRILKETASREVTEVRLAGAGSVVVKSYPRGRGFWGRLRAIGPWSAARVEWRQGLRLREAGLPGAEVLAVGTALQDGVRSSILVMETLAGARDLVRHLDVGLAPLARRALVRALARTIRGMHEAGLFHEDPHLGNFMVRGPEDAPEVVPIDLRRVVARRRADAACRIEHLLLLYRSMGRLASRTERRLFLDVYGAGAPLATRRETARAIEGASGDALRRHLRARSEAAFGDNRRFARRREGSLRWHVRRELADASLERLLADPERAFREPDAVLKRGRSSEVVACGRWVVKRVNQKRWRSRVLDRVRRGRSERALQRSFLLELCGLPTPAVAAAGRLLAGGLVRRGYLVTARVPGARHVDRALGGASPAVRATLLRAAGALAGRLHAWALAHRDLKAGNVLVAADGALLLVDLDGIRLCRSVPPARAARDLARLVRDLRDRAALGEGELAALVAGYLAVNPVAAADAFARAIENRLAAAETRPRGRP